MTEDASSFDVVEWLNLLSEDLTRAGRLIVFEAFPYEWSGRMSSRSNSCIKKHIGFLLVAMISFLAGFGLGNRVLAQPMGQIEPIPVPAVNKCPVACNGTLCGGSACWCDGEVCVT